MSVDRWLDCPVCKERKVFLEKKQLLTREEHKFLEEYDRECGVGLYGELSLTSDGKVIGRYSGSCGSCQTEFESNDSEGTRGHCR